MGDCHQNISSGDFYVVNKEFSCQIIRDYLMYDHRKIALQARDLAI